MRAFPTATYSTRHKTATRAIVSHLVHEGCWFEVTPIDGKGWDITVRDDGRAQRLFPQGAELRLEKALKPG